MHVHADDRDASPSAASEHRLLIVLTLTALYLLAELLGGLLTGSLALLADAGHLLGDVLGLSMAVAAIRFARRPATAGKTYGFYRAEILAALVNSLTLLVVAIGILYSAWQRLSDPQPVEAGPMLVVAIGGLVVTLVGVSLLHRGAQHSLNVRGAFLEVLGDLFGSVGTIVAAWIILSRGWTVADPIVSGLIGLLIVPRSIGLLRSVVDVLLEATPRHLSMREIETAMCSQPGVESVHDLHLWSITNGFEAMSGHVRSNGRASADVLHDLRTMLHDRFGLEHLTLQVESLDHADDGACCIVDPRCFVPAGVSLPAAMDNRAP